MEGKAKVLVTGADQHQGLAVIRGLGLAGIPVVACGPHSDSLGLRSRFATERFVYTSPFDDPLRFASDVLDILQRTAAKLVIPTVESTLVVLAEHREQVEQYAPLAATGAESLAIAVDKSRTVQLAQELGVPVPATLRCDSVEEALDRGAQLRFPVALKPRGHALHGPTRHLLEFKVRYAESLDALGRLLATLPDGAGVPLIQECVRGTGICVSAVFDHGRPMVLFPYRRSREWPLSGGVSVVRESIALDPRLEEYVVRLLSRLVWHGVAMVEFKYDEIEDRFALMEINARFQASTALSLDAGLNLPHLVAQLFGCVPAGPEPRGYRTGVRERWLQGDLHALYEHFRGGSERVNLSNPRYRPPSRARAMWDFLRDFRPGTRYDEFKLYDWRPGLVEGRALLGMLANWALSPLRRLRSNPARLLRSWPVGLT